MIRLALRHKDRMSWEAPVLATNAGAGEGITELCETILAHNAHLQISGESTIC